MAEFSRRQLVCATATFATTSSIVIHQSTAQAIEVPSLDLTQKIVTSSTGIEVLQRRFDLIWGIALNIALLDKGVTLESPNGIDAHVNEGRVDGARELFNIVGELRDNSARDNTFDALISDRLQDSIKAVPARIGKLVASLESRLEKEDVNPNAPLIAASLKSLYHVERIAVARREYSDDQPYLCRFFPFTIFC